MPQLLIALALAAQPAPAPAPAEGWTEINRDANRIALYDAARLTRRGDMVRFTLRFDLLQADEGAVRRTHDTEVDCARRTVRMLSAVDTDAEGRIVRTLEVPPDLALHRPIPEGPGQEMLARVCG